MARTSTTTQLDLSSKINLTAGSIERLVCPAGKAQAFLRDSTVPGLQVRVTSSGKKSFVFETKISKGDRRSTLRQTIGDVRTWSIEQARIEARRLGVIIDGGSDPRVQRQQEREKQQKEEHANLLNALTFEEAWKRYVEARQSFWGDHHTRDHERLVAAGGRTASRGTRGKGVTVSGPLHHFKGLPLRQLDARAIELWAKDGAQQKRPTATRLALRLLRAFLNWCKEDELLSSLVPAGGVAASTKKTRDALGPAKTRTDAVLRDQLRSWFSSAKSLSNPTISAYLQVLLITGARPNEVRGLKWGDVDWRWKGITYRDKVEGTRVVPLTPYVEHLLSVLPRHQEWVFASAHEGKCIAPPNHVHDKVCFAAGMKPVTLNGLRRSFKSLTEWLEIPAGVVAQIMGHKPSATAEKYYTVRPLDLLRLHHERIERWILEQADLTQEKWEPPASTSVEETDRSARF